MKKLLVILLLMSAVVGMTIPAMANAEAESHSDTSASNAPDINIAQNANNFAQHTVSVSLDDATQGNGIGTNVAASGGITNAAVANQDAKATAKDANTGDAGTGKAVSAAKSGETQADDNGVAIGGDVTSDDADSGDATSGDASNNAINTPTNTADASGNDLTTGDVHNTVAQINAIVQIVPVTITNDQTNDQTAVVDNTDTATADPLNGGPSALDADQQNKDLTDSTGVNSVI